MKHKNLPFVAIVLILLALPTLSVEAWKRFGTLRAHASATKLPVPALTAHYHEQLDNTHRRRTGPSWTVAYRGDGARAESRTFFKRDDGAPYKIRREIWFPDGRKLLVFDSDKVVSSFSFPATAYEHWKNTTHYDPVRGCVATLLGTVMGTAIGNEQRSAIESIHARYNRASDFESWRAPSLGCLELGRKAVFLNANGSVSDTSELILEFVTQGEPDLSLFTVPAEYEEVTPSEANRRVLVRNKAEEKYFTNLSQDPGIKRQDESYRQHRSR
jgi:hypothetical protein